MKKIYPWSKLLDRLCGEELAARKMMQAFGQKWPDYWRGFWDATRAIRHDASPAMSASKDMHEYMNGYQIGDRAYKAMRFAAITKPKEK